MGTGYGGAACAAQPRPAAGVLPFAESVTRRSTMQLPHDTFVVVADGRKMLFFRNEGDGGYPHLVVEHARVHPSPKDREQKSDAAGGASSTQAGANAPGGAVGGDRHALGGGAQFAPSRGTMEETDFHQLEEDRFAAETAEFLKQRALAHEYESLVVVAPPKTLGELRKHYHKEVTDRLVGELDKDLTRLTVPDIEAVISAA
jgi:protein required for attachment to host cells